MIGLGAKNSIGRRKSVNPFARSSTETSLDGSENGENGDDGERKDKKKAGKRPSLFHLTAPPVTQDDDEILSPLSSQRSNSTKSRARILQKGRPGSVFGSLGRKSGKALEEESEQQDDSHPASPSDDGEDLQTVYTGGGNKVLHHGEVQTTSGLFRKKKEYLVLTDGHLVRFKSQYRASEAYTSIKMASRRSGTTRHASTTSIGSMQDLQSLSSHASAESDNAIPLKQIVAAYKVEDGKPFFTTEVVSLDEETNTLASLQLILHDPTEADLWHTSIRGAAQKARLLSSQPYPDRVVHYLVRIIENLHDYDPEHFQIFRVIRRASVKGTGKASSDDVAKLGSNAAYMIIGINKLHLISLPDFSEPSTKMVDAKATKNSYGLVSLVSMDVRHTDDTFELGFRTPLQQPVILNLAAASSPEIAYIIFRSYLFLKPQWLDYTFLFYGPPEIIDDSNAPIPTDEDNGLFERTLVAYCMAYNCNPGRIRYAVDIECEDAPEFQLLPPSSSSNYSVHELLAVFRSLRFNESFRSISFRGINLQNLHGLVDIHGADHVAGASRSGASIRKYLNTDPLPRSLLYQEVQALAMKANRLRRLDFSNTLPKRRPRDTFDEEGRAEKDPGCEITAALLPLCRTRLTMVDWIVFNGIELGETDLEELALALDDKKCRFRSIEVSRCGLADRGMNLFLNHVERQNATLECLNISDNPARLHLDRFPITMSRFSRIRRLDLSRVTSTSGPEPLIAPEVMLSWKLEELVMTGCPVNDRTLDAIAVYLASSMSEGLYCLQMDQCNLTGAHVALLMRSMCRHPGEARNLHLHVSANRLEKGNSDIVKAIEESTTPTHLTMRMVEYGTESRFRQLLQALRTNTTIRCLDISKASLPGDAGEDTCKALQSLFEDNKTLEELDISGEHAHLEIARFGIGLSFALMGLKKNTALKVLKIEYQNLGLEGANTLSSVLEENETLEHIYCEHNDINLQGFTVLVNALAHNYTVLSLPLMLDDQTEAVKRMTAAIGESRLAATSKAEGGMKHSVRRTLTTLGVHLKENPLPTPQDIEQAVQILNSRWERQTLRMTEFLQRNVNIAAGIDTRESWIDMTQDTMRPMTAMSDERIIEHVLATTTPKGELGNPVEAAMVERLRVPARISEDDGSARGSVFGESPQKAKDRARSHSTTSNATTTSATLISAAAVGRTFELGGSSPEDTETEAS